MYRQPGRDSDATLETENAKSWFKLKTLCARISICKAYKHRGTFLNATRVYSDDTPARRDKLPLMPSYLVQCTISEQREGHEARREGQTASMWQCLKPGWTWHDGKEATQEMRKWQEKKPLGFTIFNKLLANNSHISEYVQFFVPLIFAAYFSEKSWYFYFFNLVTVSQSDPPPVTETK